jgi:hypothetical protein
MIARVTGVLFIITCVAAIPALNVFYDPVLNDPDCIVDAGADTRLFWGALLEVITVIANIGTAVVLYPIVKRQNEGVALGYVTARVLESAVTMVDLLFERHPSRAHLLERGTAELPEAPDNVSIIGCDAANGRYFHLYSDERGVCRGHEMIIGNASGSSGVRASRSPSASQRP